MEEKSSSVGSKEKDGGGKEEEEEEEEEGGGRAIITTYCVTGASGYIGSWLVNSLLLRGFNVHATVRHLDKSLHLLQQWKGGDRLKLFIADLQEEGSFDEAMRGCHGLFHVAASMELLQVPVKDNVDSYVQTKVIEPAIKGTLNVMKSCLRSGSIKRVVFTSSISTLTAKDDSENWKSFVDETSNVSISHVWETKSTGWVYVLSKLVTEQAAFEFCKENEMDMVSVVTTTVGGPFLTCTVPISIRLLLSPLTGDPFLSSILESVKSRMGSIAMVHIEDICNAHVFLMEHSETPKGRYICSATSCGMSQLVSCLLEHYPNNPTLQRIVGEEQESVVPAEISSRRLKDLGFNYIYGVQDIIGDSIVKCIECGFPNQL